MKSKIIGAVALMAVSSLLCVFLSCDSTPTVPIPPPEMTYVTVTAPDIDGIVTVSGEPDAAGSGDVVLVFNEDLGAGAMIEASADGSFTVLLEASVGDVLLVQIKRDNELSSEEEIPVPSA